MAKLGDIFGNKYKVLNKISSGGQGNVYKVLDLNSKKERALKELTSKDSSKKRERRILEHLKLKEVKGVTPLLDCDESKVPKWLVFPLRKTHLTREIINGLELDKRLTYCLIILQTLSDVHKNDVIHRDLKPQNILIKDDGNPEITDFGIGKTFYTGDYYSSNNADGLGSAYYCSPEQIKNEENVTQTDVYVGALVLYEILTGKTLEKNKDGNLNYKFISSFIPEISKDIDDVLKKACELDIKKRYKDASEFHENFRRVVYANQITNYFQNLDKDTRNSLFEMDLTSIKKEITPSLNKLVNIQSIDWNRELDEILYKFKFELPDEIDEKFKQGDYSTAKVIARNKINEILNEKNIEIMDLLHESYMDQNVKELVADLYFKIAKCNSFLEKFLEAISERNFSLKLTEKIKFKYDIYFSNSLDYEDYGNLEKAIENYLSAIELDPKSPINGQAYMNAALLLDKIGGNDQDIKEFYLRSKEEYKNNNNIDWKIFYNYGRYLKNLGDDESIKFAADEFQEGLSLEENYDLYLQLGHCYQLLKNWDLAINNYNQGLKFTDTGDIRFHLANCLYNDIQGNFIVDQQELDSRIQKLEKALFHLDVILEDQPLFYECILLRADIKVELAKINLNKNWSDESRIKKLNEIMSDFDNSITVMKLQSSLNIKNISDKKINNENLASILLCRGRANLSLWGDINLTNNDFKKALELNPGIKKSLKFLVNDLLPFEKNPPSSKYLKENNFSINFLLSTNDVLNNEKWSEVLKLLNDWDKI